MSVEVVHVRDGYDLYIGRRNNRAGLRESMFANPFSVADDRMRERVIDAYRTYFGSIPELGDLLWATYRLYKYDYPNTPYRLGCWCVPKACHGDVLKEYLEQQEAAERP